jgi:hypothetical protein
MSVKVPLFKGDLGGSSRLKCNNEKFENTACGAIKEIFVTGNLS